MAEEKFICPECNQELDRLKEFGVTMAFSAEHEADELKCRPNSVDKEPFCCPMCGYESGDPDAFMALS